MLSGSSGSYLAAGPLCCAAVAGGGWRGRRWTLPLWACVAALVACLPVPPLVEPPWTVKILPMLWDPAPVDPPEVDPPALDPPPAAVPAPGDVLLGVGSLLEVGATGAGSGWLGAGTWHALWHSARVMKLLLLPWQPPYQKCTHLEVMTS